MGRKSPFIYGKSLLVLALLASGCLPAPPDPNATRTPNATLQAISVMLTETRAAPTITPTVFLTITPTPTITPTVPVVGRIGERIQAGGLELALLTLTREQEVERLRANTEDTILSMEVALTNQSGQEMEYYPYFFRLHAADGMEFEPANTAVWPPLLGGTLRPGESVRGHLAFLVPAQTGALRMNYTVQTAQDGPLTLWVDLSQPAAASSPPTIPNTGDPAANLPGAGQRIEESGLALIIEQVSTERRLGSQRAGEGRVFLNLLATIENVSRAETPVNAFYFKTRDARGYEYAPVVVPLEALLHSGSLREGEKVSGQVVFEIPEGASRIMVLYQPQVLTEDYTEIRLGIDVPAIR